MKPGQVIVPLMVALALGGCSQEAPEEVPPRPVLSMLAEPKEARAIGFTGTVEARYSADLGFQVLGRIASRDVEVGDIVRKGQELARLDATELELAVSKAKADLESATAKLDFARLNEERQRKLLETNTSTRERLEEAIEASAAARAGVLQLQALLRKAEEQRGYATLRAETAGVVSAVAAESGQVVAAGQPVVTVARLEARDAVVDIPDGQVEGAAKGAVFAAVLQANPDLRVSGTVREIAPQADATTRTRRVKIALQDPPDAFRLGSMVTATPATDGKKTLWLPQSAIGQKAEGSFVWVVDAAQKTVNRKTVIVRPALGGVEVLDGIRAGERVVTAGVNALEENQAVRIIEETSP